MKIAFTILTLVAVLFGVSTYRMEKQLDTMRTEYGITQIELDKAVSANQDLEDQLRTTRETLYNLNGRFDKCNAHYEKELSTRAKIWFAKVNPFDNDKVVEEFE